MTIRTCLFTVLLGAALSGCSPAPGHESTCVPGREVGCACPSGEGVQVCAADGASFEACQCGGAGGAGSTSGSGGGAGPTTGSSGSTTTSGTGGVVDYCKSYGAIINLNDPATPQPDGTSNPDTGLPPHPFLQQSRYIVPMGAGADTVTLWGFVMPNTDGAATVQVAEYTGLSVSKTLVLSESPCGPPLDPVLGISSQPQATLYFTVPGTVAATKWHYPALTPGKTYYIMAYLGEGYPPDPEGRKCPADSSCMFLFAVHPPPNATAAPPMN